MPDTIDFKELYRLFLARGERVVVVMPGQEPIVLLPLSQYERLTSSLPPAAPHRHREAPPAKAEATAQSVRPATQPLEPVDPLQGALEGDDQYFPEPLEPEV